MSNNNETYLDYLDAFAAANLWPAQRNIKNDKAIGFVHHKDGRIVLTKFYANGMITATFSYYGTIEQHNKIVNKNLHIQSVKDYVG